MKKLTTLVYIFPLVCLLLGGTVSATTQSGKRHPLIQNLSIQKEGQNLVLEIDFNFHPIQLKKNQKIEFTPILVQGQRKALFTPLALRGRKANLYDQRNATKTRDAHVVTKRSPRFPLVAYRETIPYEPWMDKAHLSLVEDFCGCNRHFLVDPTLLLSDLGIETPPIAPFMPQLVFIEPQIEKVKNRTEAGSAFLDFQVGKTTILPYFRKNQQELNKINHTLQGVNREQANTLKKVVIHGYASPEGPYANNARLANGRAYALRDYIVSVYGISAEVMEVSSTPEDWVGFRDAVAQSSLPDKTAILAIMDGFLSVDAKESSIRVHHPQSYRYIYQEIYPKLRRSDYRVEYEVRAFSLEESRRIFEENPKLLSLNELYRLAFSYEIGSADYNKVLTTAAVLFPNDGVANLNAANAAVINGNLKGARDYLSKAIETPEKTHTEGILYLLEGDIVKGKELLHKAYAEGIRDAKVNLTHFEEWEAFQRERLPID